VARHWCIVSTSSIRRLVPFKRGHEELLDNAAIDGEFRPATLYPEKLSGAEAFEPLAREWGALAAQISPRTPFTTPLWNILWWKHFHADRLVLRDELNAYVVRDTAGQLRAVAPMMLTYRPSIGPVRVRILQFFGADPNITEVRGLICRPQDQGEVIAELTRCFLDRSTDWDWLDWACMRDTEAARRQFFQSGAIVRDDTPGYYLALPPTWEELRASRPRNIKESLRKCYNSLKRAGQSFGFRVVERPDETLAALDTFFDLHAGRAGATGVVEHRNVFAAPRERAFLTEYAWRMAERGQLRIFQLEIAGKVVATRLGFLFGDELYLYYSGYDMTWARFSVMTTVVAESIKWAISQRLKIVNLSHGRDVSKVRWAPTTVTFCSARQFSSSRRARLAFRAYDTAKRLFHTDSQLAKLLTVTAGR
jgi:hypothetical protein